MSGKLLPAGFMAAAVVALTGTANAGLVIVGNPLASTEQTGANFTAELNYSFIGGNQGTLSVLMTNTSDPAFGGGLTSFLFNVGSSDPGVAATLSASSHAAMTDAAGASGAPFGGSFVGGAGTGGQFEGGGPPSGGIAPGDTGSFTFNIVAADAAALTANAFIQGDYDFNFVVRFRGMDNDAGSDKVPGTRIPTPGSLGLLALAGTVAARRRRH